LVISDQPHLTVLGFE